MGEGRRFKVCVYCDRWQNGGVEAYLMNLFRFWDKSKLDAELVVSEVTTDLYDDELQALGIRRRVTLQQVYHNPVERILHNLSAVRRLFQSERYDAAYFNLSNSFTMCYAYMAKKAGIPVRVVHSHCSSIQKGALRSLKKAGHVAGQRLFSAAATDTFACSREAAQWLFGAKGADVKLIHNSIDVQRFQTNQQARSQAKAAMGLDGKWVIGTVGRLTELKNTDFLIHAFSELCALRQDAYLLVVGEGELKPVLEAMIDSLNLKDKVLLYGVTNHVPRMLWAMDVFCLPSRFEGNPVSVIEAQAAGCACLVSDTVTRQCQVCDNVSFIPVGEPKVWAKAMSDACLSCPPEKAAEQVKGNGYDAAVMSASVQAMLYKACLEADKTVKGGEAR